MYLILTTYVYDFFPILFLQVHHHNNFKPVKGRPDSRQISSSSYDAITVSDFRGTQIESPREQTQISELEINFGSYESNKDRPNPRFSKSLGDPGSLQSFDALKTNLLNQTQLSVKDNEMDASGF
jgi:hypothetical protein